MAGRILILRWGGSAYESLGGLLDLTCQEFTAEGQQVATFAADGQDWPNRLVALLGQGGISFALTMSGIGADLMVDGNRLLWEAAKVPLFNWCCDHPCYFPSRHGIRSRFLLHGYVFPDHARYNVAHLNPNGMACAVHLGMPPRSLFPAAPLPHDVRNGRLVFSKSGQDTNAIEARWRDSHPMLRQILFDGAEALRDAATEDFVPTLQPLAERQGLLLHGNSELTLFLIRELDAYLRFRRANLVAQTIADYPVDVFGTGWDHLPWAGRARRRGPLGWQLAVRELPRYLGCLSINPLVQHSAHDRVFFALAAGVVPVSDSNGFSRARLPGLERYAFGFTRERIAAAVEAVLDDPRQALAATEAAWQELTPEFTLRRSAQQIMQFVALHGANARCAA